MKLLGEWNCIKHYGQTDMINLNDFSKLINNDEVFKLKCYLISKQKYRIEIKPHPSNHIKDGSLLQITKKKIICYIPERIKDNYVLFGGGGDEVEFSHDELCQLLATSLRASLEEYIWLHSMPKETYIEYLNKTMG